MASSEFSPHDILSRRLVRWGVSEEAADKLTRENSEVVQILQLNCLELMRQTNRNPDFNEIIIDKIAGKCAPTLRTLKDLITEKEFLPSVPTSLLPLDRLLEGGIPRGSVTEFVGPPAILDSPKSVTSTRKAPSRPTVSWKWPKTDSQRK